MVTWTCYIWHNTLMLVYYARYLPWAFTSIHLWPRNHSHDLHCPVNSQSNLTYMCIHIKPEPVFILTDKERVPSTPTAATHNFADGYLKLGLTFFLATPTANSQNRLNNLQFRRTISQLDCQLNSDGQLKLRWSTKMHAALYGTPLRLEIEKIIEHGVWTLLLILLLLLFYLP